MEMRLDLPMGPVVFHSEMEGLLDMDKKDGWHWWMSYFSRVLVEWKHFVSMSQTERGRTRLLS